MAVDEAENVYLLAAYTDAATGKLTGRQELRMLTQGFLPLGRIKTLRLGKGDENTTDVNYLHVQVTTSVVLAGVSADGDIVREAYDAEELKQRGGATIKSSRKLPNLPGEDIYRIVLPGSDAVFLTKTGRVYHSAEDMPQPVLLFPDYPEGSDAYLSSYAAFIAETGPGQLLAGEQKSGDILRLYTDGSTAAYAMEGNRALGSLPYTGGDLLELSMRPGSENSWVAAVQNPQTGASELVMCDDGVFTLVTRIGDGRAATVLATLGQGVLIFLAILITAFAARGLYRLISGSRMIVIKLIATGVPLLLLALTLFGAYSYGTYRSSLVSTYETKASDQGNLLRALFGSASFDTITAPGLYGSVEYEYLRAQMATRDVYTSSAYYVDGKLYTGVDPLLPCLYPFGIRHSADAWRLYRTAALTGTQQAGTVTDRLGERIVCVTPVGSSSGDTVFLLETGVFQEEISSQTSGYLRGYLAVTALCLLSACLLLTIAFLRILRPLGDIAEGLDKFSRGDRTARLSTPQGANDELADISRVFNKMAKDIDVQIYNLKTMGDTYYRFVPQQVFRLLGRENLNDVELGSAVEGEYCVLVANLYPRQGRSDFEAARESVNRFFETVHRVAQENGATLLSDSAGLKDLRLICPDGDSAARAAMDAIARIDSHNATCPLDERLDVSFFLHCTRIGFGICGDGERYVPAMISAELDETLHICDEFRRFSSRLIVTQEAYDRLDGGSYFNRYIGYITSPAGGRGVGLYDFYDSSSPASIRLLNETLGAFTKAMELYAQKRYYDAKNIFTMILRENQYDNVTRHYIFQCEKKL